MPVEPYATRLEASDDAIVWRVMDLRKFRDLMASEDPDVWRSRVWRDVKAAYEEAARGEEQSGGSA